MGTWSTLRFSMMYKVLVCIILLCTFGSAFLATTALFDTMDKRMGIYNEGIQAERELFEAQP